MSWEDDLFAVLDDLEQQAESLFDGERGVELLDRSRAEYATVTLASRLMASLGRELALDVRGVGRVAGRLERVATGWCLVAGPGQDWLVRSGAISTVVGASERAVPEVAWSPVARLGLGSAVRRLADAGEPCRVHLLDGRCHELVPTRVGQDFVEGRSGATSLLVALDSVAAVQSRRDELSG
ncbi:hypothetical protein ACFP3Q_12575 [Nocardioides sp. GCM10027113]|uniref:hypothetical protein n=1 Tax=unclassified Nocardioides TaxID=2615069 RepID=UPI00361B14AF